MFRPSVIRFSKNGLLVAAGVCATFPVSQAVAQQEGVWPKNQDAFPGQIVYSRDVPYGSATRRVSQGEASTVTLDQSPLIDRTLALGLEPLTDSEQSLITAPLRQATGIAMDALTTAIPTIGERSASSGIVPGETAGSATTSAIDRGLSVLPGVLSILAPRTDGGK